MRLKEKTNKKIKGQTSFSQNRMGVEDGGSRRPPSPTGSAVPLSAVLVLAAPFPARGLSGWYWSVESEAVAVAAAAAWTTAVLIN